MAVNKEWHLRNKMPEKPTFDERLKWHTEHNKNCNCHPGLPKKLIEDAIKKGIKL